MFVSLLHSSQLNCCNRQRFVLIMVIFAEYLHVSCANKEKCRNDDREKVQVTTHTTWKSLMSFKSGCLQAAHVF